MTSTLSIPLAVVREACADYLNSLTWVAWVSRLDAQIAMTAFCSPERDLGLSPVATVMMIKMQMLSVSSHFISSLGDTAVEIPLFP
jgi:hypothetical protein